MKLKMSINIFRRYQNVLLCNPVVVDKIRHFHEADKKGGYQTKIKRPIKEHVKEGIDELKKESLKFAKEIKWKVRSDIFCGALQHEDYDIFYRLNDQQSVNDWIVTSDLDNNEGKSSCEFILGPNKKGLFRGCINTLPAKDGIIKQTGYANIRSPKAVASFHRNAPLDWTCYTHLIVCCRGDGRPYQVVIGMDRYFDVCWYDQYTYALFTRGGPYLQISKIPFSKFFLAAKGRIQDKQERIQLDRVSYVGFTLADGYNGPFELELDWIGVMYDANHHQNFEYEMYETSKM